MLKKNCNVLLIPGTITFPLVTVNEQVRSLTDHSAL